MEVISGLASQPPHDNAPFPILPACNHILRRILRWPLSNPGLSVEVLVGILEREVDTNESGLSTNLIASNFLTDEVKSFDNMKTKLFPLLVFCDRNVFNMSNSPTFMDTVRSKSETEEHSASHSQLPLLHQGSRAHDFPISVTNDERVICIRDFRFLIVLFHPFSF